MTAQFRFSVHRAGDARSLAQAMTEGQRRALRPYGIEHIVPSGEIDPNVILVAAEEIPGQVCAGIRFTRRTSDRRLPLEAGITLPDSVLAKLEHLQAEGLAELGAYWVAPEVVDRSLAMRILRFAVAWADEHLPHLVALGGQHSIPLALRVGFHLDASEPEFAYPDARYHSHLVWRSAREALPMPTGADEFAATVAATRFP